MSVNDVVARELAMFPRGDLAQNVFRSVYQNIRAHGLAEGRLSTSPDEARRAAISVVRKQFPAFAPEMAPLSNAP